MKRFFRHVFTALVAAVVVAGLSGLFFMNIDVGPGGAMSLHAGAVEAVLCAAAFFFFPGRSECRSFRMTVGALTGVGCAGVVLECVGTESLRAGFPGWVLPVVWAGQGAFAGLATGLLAEAFRRNENATWLLGCIAGVIPSSVIFSAFYSPYVTHGRTDPVLVLIGGAFGSLYAAPVCVIFGVACLCFPTVPRFSPNLSRALLKGIVVGAVSGVVYLVFFSAFESKLYSEFLMGPTLSFTVKTPVWIASGMLYATMASFIRHACRFHNF